MGRNADSNFISRFANCLSNFKRGYDVGLRPNPLLFGELPLPRNREQRRGDKFKNGRNKT